MDMDYERAAVNKGAKLLDKILPGWHNQVHLQTLRMDNPSLCMMGQLFGGRVEGDLAREMYPEEMKAMGRHDGYTKALCHGLVELLMTKLGMLGIKGTNRDSYSALEHACSGHDTKCLWAEAVAERVARDAVQGAHAEAK